MKLVQNNSKYKNKCYNKINNTHLKYLIWIIIKRLIIIHLRYKNNFIELKNMYLSSSHTLPLSADFCFDFDIVIVIYGWR